MNKNCTIITKSLSSHNRKSEDEQIANKDNNGINLVFHKDDTLDDLEVSLYSLNGTSSVFYLLKKRVSSSFLTFVSGVIIMFALLSTSLYEDVFKKILFESPLQWTFNDSVSMLFVLLFFFGLLMMPSILEGESSELKSGLQSWFNKDVRRLKKLKFYINGLDKNYKVNIYNVELLLESHWVWKLLIPSLIKHFIDINFFIRCDKKDLISKRLKELGITNINFDENVIVPKSNTELLLSEKENELYELMHLSSTSVTKVDNQKDFISLELFEYCGRTYLEEQNNNKNLISSFQSFVTRCFDDFFYLTQEESSQVYFTDIVKNKKLENERKKLSYFLRNHIEECLEYFDNPISFLILYYYVKDIVLDEKRTVLILEKLIYSIKIKQQYDLIDTYWFKIAGEMFDSKDIESFEQTNGSIYRKLSVDSLNDLKFLFERNGYFEQAMLIVNYLYEINPSKYAIDTCSLYERMGNYDKAYESLPKEFVEKSSTKPDDTHVRYLQRKAWIIVSQRREDKKEEGIESLEKLHNILFSHNKDNEPIWLWHYYNIRANYCEWNESYDEAIENYKKCLSIPTLGAFEYGGTFINTSIAYRLKYISNGMVNIDTIDESVAMGKIGVILKDSVGDRDEMPVVLHNQALNILYKILNKFDESLAFEAITLTSRGIEILESTNSMKRLGILLCENIIAKSILKEDSKQLKIKLQNHWLDIEDYEKEQIKQIYSKFQQKDIVEKLDT